jgi:hypothetical protein
MLPTGARRGRSTIVVDEWGPYDWKSPKLWPVLNANPARPLPYRLDRVDAAARKATPDGATRGEPVRLAVLGPEGAWRLVSSRGATATPASGTVGDVVTVTPRRDSGAPIDYEIALEYRGREVTSPRGLRTAAGAPYVFGFAHFHAPIDWSVRFFEFSNETDPAKTPDLMNKVLSGTTLKTITIDRLDYLSGGSLENGLPRDRFALVADGTANLPAGDYTIQTISDDGVRVWVDGNLLIDAWDPHESRIDRAHLTGGTRRIKVHYYEATGWAEMKLTIQPRRAKK